MASKSMSSVAAAARQSRRCQGAQLHEGLTHALYAAFVSPADARKSIARKLLADGVSVTDDARATLL